MEIMTPSTSNTTEVQGTSTRPATPDLQQSAQKPAQMLKWIDLLNISIGFLGIQFGWAIQMGQMPALIETLGANAQLTGFIFAAGPVTGILVQPIVGALSDNSTNSFGRRRPFLLVGAILTAISLILMPNSVNLLMAAILLWVLDASINITQGPYRALVPDVVKDKGQQATTYSLMSLTIGLGAVASFLIGSKLTEMHTLFYLGATAILLAMGWTILTTPETPVPKTIQNNQVGTSPLEALTSFFVNTAKSISEMPLEGKKLCIAHSFTWFGLGCLFIFFSQFVPHNIFGATGTKSALYTEGVQWASLCYAVNNTVCFGFSALIGPMCQATSKKFTHTFGLLTMAAAMISMYFIADAPTIMVAMGIIGMGWATTLSLPFALLADHVPAGKEGVLMGTFNVFIAAPMLITSLCVGTVVDAMGGDRSIAMVMGGIAMVISALILQFVREEKRPHAVSA